MAGIAIVLFFPVFVVETVSKIVSSTITVVLPEKV
jgi:hypothetical protein